MSSGFQNNNVIQIDVVLTKLGRYYRSINSPLSKVTKFALSDDGVDYNLFDSNLPTDQQALKIERTPVLDAWTNQDALMKNKLLTISRAAAGITGNLNITPASLSFIASNAKQVDKIVQTVTINAGFPTPNGFNVTIADSSYLYLNNPPYSDQNNTSNVSSSSSTSNITPMGPQGFNPVVVQTGGTGVSNKVPQTVKIPGSNNIPSSATFSVIYDASYVRYGSTTVQYSTQIRIDSIDGGYTKYLNVTLIAQ